MSPVDNPHRRRAAEMYSVDARDVTPEMYRAAKLDNFITQYGGLQSIEERAKLIQDAYKDEEDT